MALFSPSESVYITSFLSAVDLDSSIGADGSVEPGIADRVPHAQGREALVKATKDLMSLDIPVSSNHHHALSHPSHLSQGHLSNGPSYWPSIPGAESVHQQQRQSLSPASPSSIFSAQHPLSQYHVQIAPLRSFDPTSSSPTYMLPPITTPSFPNGLSGHDGAQACSAALPASASAPSLLANTSTLAKRPLPSSSQPATDPSSSKRLRASPSSSGSFPSAPDAESPSGSRSGAAAAVRPRRSTASGPGQSKSSHGVSQVASGSSSANGSSGGGSGGGGGATGGASAKGTLLSPSQKRANHIQSEQKRRANIRRGYEALCEVVPALREAIEAEDERERAKERDKEFEEGSSLLNGKGKARGAAGGADKGKKKKGRGEGEKPDGRAGPRSENVVLQKTIDYVTGLIAERTALQQRLELARGMLPLDHPALPVEPHHLDPKGVPLWEREWNGGMDLDIADLGGAQEEEGSEDES